MLHKKCSKSICDKSLAWRAKQFFKPGALINDQLEVFICLECKMWINVSEWITLSLNWKWTKGIVSMTWLKPLLRNLKHCSWYQNIFDWLIENKICYSENLPRISALKISNVNDFLVFKKILPRVLLRWNIHDLGR